MTDCRSGFKHFCQKHCISCHFQPLHNPPQCADGENAPCFAAKCVLGYILVKIVTLIRPTSKHNELFSGCIKRALYFFKLFKTQFFAAFWKIIKRVPFLLIFVFFDTIISSNFQTDLRHRVKTNNKPKYQSNYYFVTCSWACILNFSSFIYKATEVGVQKQVFYQWHYSDLENSYF